MEPCSTPMVRGRTDDFILSISDCLMMRVKGFRSAADKYLCNLIEMPS